MKKVSRPNYVKHAGAGTVVVAGAAARGYYATRSQRRAPIKIQICPIKKDEIEELYSAGATEISLNLEVYDSARYGSLGGFRKGLIFEKPDIREEFIRGFT